LQRGITNTTFFRLLSTISNFLIALLLARFMGPKIKGDATIFITTITFLVFFCSFVGGQALVYLVPRFRVENLIIPAYVWTIVVAGISLILFRHFGVFTWRRSVNVCTISILSSLVNINASVLLAKQEIRRYNIVNLIPVFFTVIGLLIGIFVYKSDDIYGYLYPLYVAYIIALVVSFYYTRGYINLHAGAATFDDIDSALKYGVGYQIFELLQLLNFRFYFFLLYHIQGPSDLGLFSIGVSILEVVWIFGRSVFVIHYSDFSNSDNRAVAVEQTLRYIKIVFITSLAILLLIALCPSSVYGFVFGGSFAEVKYLVKYLFPGVLMYSITLVIQSIYLSRARYGVIIFAQLSGLVVSVALCYLWIPHYFYSGASAAASIAYIVCTIIMLAFFMRDYQVPFSKFMISRADIDFINNVFNSYLRRRKDS
jgi:O-antigen/teichoic acid export membrane protein